MEPKRSIRKGIIFLFVLMVVLVSGCRKPVSIQKEVTLKYAYFGGVANIRIIEQAVKAFEKENPGIHIDAMHIAGSFWEKLFAMVASETTPDVMALDTRTMTRLAHQGILADLGPFMNNDPEFQSLRKDIMPALFDAVKSKDGIYCVPAWCNPAVLYYNKNLFDEAGLKYPDESWTWDTLLEACKKLTKDTGGDGRIDQYGIVMPPPSFGVLPYVWQNGGEVFDENTEKWCLSNKNALEALHWCYDLLNKYKVSPKYSEVQQFGDYQLFATGKVAMCEGGKYYVPLFGSIKNFNWDVTVVPKRKNRLVPSGLAVWAMKKDPKYPEECWKWMKFLMSSTVQKLICAENNDVPILISVLNSKYFLIPSNPPKHYEAYITALKESRDFPLHPKIVEVESVMYKNMELAFMGKVSIEDAAKKTDREVNQILMSGKDKKAVFTK